MRKHIELRSLVEQYYDIQQKRVQAYNRVVAWIKEQLGWESIVRELAKDVLGEKYNSFELPILDSYDATVEEIEKRYEVLMPPLQKKYAWYADRLIEGKAYIEDIENMVWAASRLIELEKEIEQKIKNLVKEFQVYTDYLSKINGIGPVLAAGLIGWIAPIDRFKYPSKLRAYAGLSAQHYKMKCEQGHRIIATSPKADCPVRKKGEKRVGICGARIVEAELIPHPPRRVVGYYTMVNLKLKSHFWRCVRSFEYLNPRNSYYRHLYDKIKAYYAQRDGVRKTKKEAEGKTPGHIRNMAILWTASIFASHMWEAWRRLEGLEIKEPYQIEKLGHVKLPVMTDFESPIAPRFKVAEIA